MRNAVFVDYSDMARYRLMKKIKPYCTGDIFFFNPVKLRFYDSLGRGIKFSIFRKKYFDDSVLIVTGHRPWDLLLTIFWKKKQKKVFYVQHAKYTSEVNRTMSLSLALLVKAYSVILPSIILFFVVGAKSAYYAFAGRFRHKYIYKFRAAVPISRYDYCFVYDDKWEKYHKNLFGEDKVLKVGFFDFNDGLIIDKCESRRIVYVLHAFYEDGVYKLSYCDEVISFLKRISKKNDVPIVFKPHPRSVGVVKERFAKYFEETNILYRSDVVLGHYSTIMSMAKSSGNQVFTINVNAVKIPLEVKGDYDVINSDAVIDFSKRKSLLKREKTFSTFKAIAEKIFE